ncbi:hypothetical protein HRbin29_00201 [bacterium HR29]|nr:hypothetical protein HRbin29_00201 [bacterium HR29]
MPATETTATEAPPPAEAPDPSPPSGGRRRRRSRGGGKSGTAAAAPPAEAPSTTPSPEAVSLEPLLQRIAELAETVREQSRQIDRLARAVAELAERPVAAAPPAKVGVFVDVANIELAAERARVRLDWGEVLARLTHDRQLVRAVAYAPVHDDPQVSPESQRFVEPFLDKGYKIVTKPLRRFADGSIKANVDIEMALDIVTLADRLDVVVLVSGDGDFAHLVEALQARGVRVEVVGFEQSTASVLRNAADRYIDILSLVRNGRR